MSRRLVNKVVTTSGCICLVCIMTMSVIIHKANSPFDEKFELVSIHIFSHSNRRLCGNAKSKLYTNRCELPVICHLP